MSISPLTTGVCSYNEKGQSFPPCPPLIENQKFYQITLPVSTKVSPSLIQKTR